MDTFEEAVTGRSLADGGLLQTIFDNFPLMVTCYDADGNLVYVNRAWEQFTGWPLERIRAEGSEACFEALQPDPDQRQQVFQYMAASIPNVWQDFPMTVEGGVVRDTAWKNIQLPNGLSVGVGQDITERKRANEELKASQERFRLLFEHSLDAIAIADDEGRYVECNDAACRLLGYERPQLLSMRVTDLQTPVAPPVSVQFQEYVRKGEEDGEFTFFHPDGQARIIEYKACRFAPGLHLSIMRDVTARRLAEKQAGERQAEIEALNVRLQRAMRETHHRVKNNLQVISAMIDMRVMESEGPVPADELRRLGNQVRALSAVHDLLTHEAKAGGDLAYVSARAVLERLMLLLRSTAQHRGFHSSFDDAPMAARKGTSLALVVSELVSNALKHGTGDIAVTFTVADGHGRLEVCDDGDGFPDGFNPAKSANTGIDLVENLSRWDLGGEAAYGNGPEGGACVKVTFPLA
jgi:PAS domain S-box-containing protein